MSEDEPVALEDCVDEDTPTESSDDNGGGRYPYDRNFNDRHRTPQRCRWCGEDFPTAGRRNYPLNVHEADCEAREDHKRRGDSA